MLEVGRGWRGKNRDGGREGIGHRGRYKKHRREKGGRGRHGVRTEGKKGQGTGAGRAKVSSGVGGTSRV